MEKTNVMRILDAHHIIYQSYCYLDSGAISGIDVADTLVEDYNHVYKTLVTTSKSNNNYVFLIPVNKELDLKKASNEVNEKWIEMIKAKDLLSLTGYIHGGCSPIGMKKTFLTVIDSSINNINELYCSAGKIGYQIKISKNDLKKIINYHVGDITN